MFLEATLAYYNERKLALLLWVTLCVTDSSKPETKLLVLTG